MNYITIRELMDNILDNPLMLDISLERVIKYTVDFIRIIGMPAVFEEKNAIIHSEDYRAELPCDFYEELQLKAGEICMRSCTDSFKEHNAMDYTYNIKGRILYSSIKNGDIILSYRALPIDDEGNPLIVDNPSFIKALELYILKLYLFPKVALGILNALVYSIIQQDYAWAVGQASTSLIRPNLNQMESITNMWNTLIPRISEHRNGFKTLGTKELIRRQ